MTDRERILARARAALGPTPPAPAATYPELPADRPTRDQLVAHFCARVTDYQATATCIDTVDELGDALAAACTTRGTRRAVHAPGEACSIPGVETVADSIELAPADLDAYDGALTGCALAIAETGTIILDGGHASGRRALTLVPDHHLCVVRADQIVADLPTAIAQLATCARAGQPLTFVSGPSATSDIELERVEGVHGPRKLDVFILAT